LTDSYDIRNQDRWAKYAFQTSKEPRSTSKGNKKVIDQESIVTEISEKEFCDNLSNKRTESINREKDLKSKKKPSFLTILIVLCMCIFMIYYSQKRNQLLNNIIEELSYNNQLVAENNQLLRLLSNQNIPLDLLGESQPSRKQYVPVKKLPSRKTLQKNFQQFTQKHYEKKESSRTRPVDSSTKPKKKLGTDNPLINFQPYRLSPDTQIYNSQEQTMLLIKTSLLVSMFMEEKNNDFFEIKFESWVIQSHAGKTFSRRNHNSKQIHIVRSVNTRTAPILENKYLIGTLRGNNTFSLVREQAQGHTLWYQIVVRGFVSVKDLR